MVYCNAVIATPMTLALLLLTGETTTLATFPHAGETGFWVGFIVSCAMGLLLTYTSILCTTYNSPLATSITGNSKDVITTLMGWFVFSGFNATVKSVGGICISFVGAFLYSYVNLMKSRQQQQKEGGMGGGGSGGVGGAGAGSVLPRTVAAGGSSGGSGGSPLAIDSGSSNAADLRGSGSSVSVALTPMGVALTPMGSAAPPPTGGSSGGSSSSSLWGSAASAAAAASVSGGSVGGGGAAGSVAGGRAALLHGGTSDPDNVDGEGYAEPTTTHRRPQGPR